MKKLVLFVLVDEFADHEYPFLASSLQDGIKELQSPYEVKTLAVSKDPLKSMGGFTILPDYSINDCPDDFSALVLIGGNTWRDTKAKLFAPLLKDSMDKGRIVGAICDATVFMGMNALLNTKKHTSNTLSDLMAAGKDSYTGQNNYQYEQAVRDGNLVTANGSAYLEFTAEVLEALDAFPLDYIQEDYRLYKFGYYEAIASATNP
ncbi:MAG: DJ-1/PfpI family protein [Coriobacteriia bacterium]|nr:DJ-1/PfpI family protein [Coriobacteriia bacterium]